MNLKRAGKIFAGFFLVLIFLIGVLFAVGILGVPDGGLDGNEWGEVEEDRIEVLTTVWVDNPNPFGVGGDTDVEYDISLQGVELAAGSGTDLGISSGYNEIVLSTDLRQQRLPQWWASHLNNDEVSDLDVDATVHTSLGPFSGSPSGSHSDEIDTDIEGALDDGFSEFEGEYSATGTGLRTPDGTAIEPTVVVDDATTRWGEVTENETEIRLTTTITNPNAYPIPTPAFTGDVELNEIAVADWNASEVELLEADEDATIPPGETEQRTFVVVMENQNVPDWFRTHVDREEFTEMAVAGQLAFSVSENQVTIPQEGDGLRCEFELTTSIFVDQEDGLDRTGCGLTPIETTMEELDATGATLDITETDWWQEQFGDDDGILDPELPTDEEDTDESDEDGDDTGIGDIEDELDDGEDADDTGENGEDDTDEDESDDDDSDDDDILPDDDDDILSLTHG